jgi:hypothetical protein
MIRNKELRIGITMALLLIGASLCGCYRVTTPQVSVPGVKEVVIERDAPPPPGVVQYIWEEPMVDVVEVPPGLDPEGHYYRPGHQEVVEIRQGKWRPYRFPDN